MTAVKSMQCPSCGSHYTQSVKMAYSQAVRTGESGYTTISEFGRSLEPPAPRSTIGAPMGVAFGVACASMLLLPALHKVIPVTWFAGLSSLDAPVVVVSIVFGVVAWFRSVVSAFAHNASVHRGEMNKWARGVVCRRCGRRFRP